MGLYPAAYRARFGEEQAGVFCQAAKAAKQRGRGWLILLLLRELACLPGVFLRCHLPAHLPAARLLLLKQLAGPEAAHEAATLLFFFTLPVVFILPDRLVGVLALTWMAFAGVALLVGLMRGLPRRSMPFAGILISSRSCFRPFSTFQPANRSKLILIR